MGNKIARFEDLIAWQKARELTVKIYLISRRGEFAKDYRLSGQIQAAAVSIMSNLAEGFERGGLGEFHQFPRRRPRVRKSVPNCMSLMMSDTSPSPCSRH